MEVGGRKRKGRERTRSALGPERPVAWSMPASSVRGGPAQSEAADLVAVHHSARCVRCSWASYARYSRPITHPRRDVAFARGKRQQRGEHLLALLRGASAQIGQVVHPNRRLSLPRKYALATARQESSQQSATPQLFQPSLPVLHARVRSESHDVSATESGIGTLSEGSVPA